MKNQYFFTRHGKSLANELGIILSDPREGTTDFGLTEEGREQARVSADMAQASGVLDATALIVSSDFTRARETAEIIAEVLGVPDIVLSEKLRERYFGNWEKQHNRHYQDVWDRDQYDSSHTEENVESVDAVRERTASLVKELEERHGGRNIVLVSHGDALQILQTVFENVPGSAHRSIKHLDTAEIRKAESKID